MTDPDTGDMICVNPTDLCNGVLCDSDQTCYTDPDTGDVSCMATNTLCNGVLCDSDQICYEDPSGNLSCVDNNVLCGGVMCDTGYSCITDPTTGNSSCCQDNKTCGSGDSATCCGSLSECIDDNCCSLENVCSTLSGDTCCGADQTCTLNSGSTDNVCCDSSNVCGDLCCDSTDECIDGGCCASDNVCSTTAGDICCDGTSICITDTSGENICCDAANVCGDVCCDSDETCVNGVCCKTDNTCADSLGDDTCCTTECCSGICCDTGETCNNGECEISCGSDFCDPDTQICDTVTDESGNTTSYCVNTGCVWSGPVYTPGNLNDSAGSNDIQVCATTDGKLYSVNNPYGVTVGDLSRSVVDTQDPSSSTSCDITDCDYHFAEVGITNIGYDSSSGQCSGQFSCSELPDLSGGCPYDVDASGNMNAACGQDPDGNFSGQVCAIDQIFSSTGDCIYGYSINSNSAGVNYCKEATVESDVAYTSLSDCELSGYLGQNAKCYLDDVNTIVTSDFIGNGVWVFNGYFVLAIYDVEFVSITLPDNVTKSDMTQNYTNLPYIMIFETTGTTTDDITLVIREWESDGINYTDNTVTISNMYKLLDSDGLGRATMSGTLNSYQAALTTETGTTNVNFPPLIIISNDINKSVDCLGTSSTIEAYCGSCGSVPTTLESGWETGLNNTNKEKFFSFKSVRKYKTLSNII
ncbi:MAG: hypothetical protein JKX76_02735 [Colwellia sp.]|nr:hypothetical protein [Colwellia sp.]